MRRKPYAVLLTAEEHKAIEEAAKAAGMSLSAYLRETALAAAAEAQAKADQAAAAIAALETAEVSDG